MEKKKTMKMKPKRKKWMNRSDKIPNFSSSHCASEVTFLAHVYHTDLSHVVQRAC